MCLTSSLNCLCTSITGKISMAPTPLLAKGNGTLARKWRKIKKRCSSFSSGDSLSRSKSEDRSSHCAANGLSNFSLSHSHKVSDVECSTDDLRTHSRDHSVSIFLDFIICNCNGWNEIKKRCSSFGNLGTYSSDHSVSIFFLIFWLNHYNYKWS